VVVGGEVGIIAFVQLRGVDGLLVTHIALVSAGNGGHLRGGRAAFPGAERGI
jgi:hypothetical protein